MTRLIYHASKVLLEFGDHVARGEHLPLSEIEENFFLRIKLGNGVYKTTNRFRLDPVNQAFASALLAERSKPEMFLDVAASSGVTTLRWLESLRDAGLSPRMTLSDLSLSAFLVSVRSWLKVLVDKTNKPLEFELFGHSLCAHARRVDILTGRCFLIWAAHAFYRYAVRIGLAPLAAGSGDRRDATALPLKLVCHEIRNRGDVSFVDDDIMQDNPPELIGAYDVIRAANILQYVYFKRGAIERAVHVLRQRLKGEGSWFIVARTFEEARNDATIFRLQDGRFEVKARIGRGSEIEDLVRAAS